MFSALQSCTGWVGQKTKQAFNYLAHSEDFEIRVHTLIEAFAAFQGTAFFTAKNTDAALSQFMDIDPYKNDDMGLSYLAICPTIIMTLLAAYGAYACHQATDIGNSLTVTDACEKDKSLSLPTEAEIMTWPRKIACAGERMTHSLGVAGCTQELLTGLLPNASLATQVSIIGVGFFAGLKASNREINNAKVGWMKEHKYNLLQNKNAEHDLERGSDYSTLDDNESIHPSISCQDMAIHKR